MSQTLDLKSIGSIAAELQHPVSDLAKIVESLEIKPAMRINNLGFFTAGDVSRITNCVRKLNHQTGTK